MKQISVLKLFKGYIGEKTETISKEALKYGLLLQESASKEVFDDAIRLYGKDGNAWNQTFHKSWKKVADAPIEQLVFEQLIHYFTTYGFEKLGIFSHESVYIPHEQLEVPELDQDVELICIRAFTKQEVSEKLMALLTSGIALSKDSIACIADLAELVDMDRFEQIRNREARIALCDAFSICPKDPDEFLRYIIYKATGSSLKIQDKETFASLKRFSRKELFELFERYLKDDKSEGMKKLASVFFRNKMLFLAMKTSAKDIEASDLLSSSENMYEEIEMVKKMNHRINTIRKKADKYHKPLSVNKLDRLTCASVQIEDEELLKALDQITVFREIRILNGLAYALNEERSILYRIRNGKSFATKRDELNADEAEQIAKRHALVYQHLIGRLRSHLSGKKIAVNKDINYKAPTSEKQFVGNFPCGSSIEVKRESDVLFGIHWMNVETQNKDSEDNGRVDLDLHLQNLEMSFGWNSAYRSEGKEILFSGDMTDAPAPDGASELFYISQDMNSTFMFTINKYTDNDSKIPFEIVLAKAKAGLSQEELEGKHLLDPNDIILKIPMEMENGEFMMRLGFVYAAEDSIKVVFDSFKSRRTIISDNEDPVFTDTFNYLTAYQKASLSLKELLEKCGGEIIEADESETIENADHDLRLNRLSKDTIISLFDDHTK